MSFCNLSIREIGFRDLTACLHSNTLTRVSVGIQYIWMLWLETVVVDKLLILYLLFH